MQLAQKLGDLKGMFLRDVESRRVENVPAGEEEGKFLTRRCLGKEKMFVGY